MDEGVTSRVYSRFRGYLSVAFSLLSKGFTDHVDHIFDGYTQFFNVSTGKIEHISKTVHSRYTPETVVTAEKPIENSS